MDLIYAETSDIIVMLDKRLPELKTLKEEEIASFSLKYISLPAQTKKLVKTENNLSLLTSVFNKCSKIRRKSLFSRLSKLNAFGES